MAERKKLQWDEHMPIKLTFVGVPRYGSGSRKTRSQRTYGDDGVEVVLACIDSTGAKTTLNIHMAQGFFTDQKTQKDYRAPYVSVNVTKPDGSYKEIFGGELGKIPPSIEKMLEDKQPGETQMNRIDWNYVLPSTEEEEDND
jgi:hypothetical protein